MKQNDGQVGMTLGSIGTCEIDDIYTWCPDIFTDLTHPDAYNFINNVISGMWRMPIFLFVFLPSTPPK